jgi:KUP system potassium uptake protein
MPVGLPLWGAGFVFLVVRACGVVYRDIGTSVLYTLREIFFGAHTHSHIPITPDNILGAVALIFWALLLLIMVKYIGFVLYADYHGEGGVFALLGLLDGVKFLGAGAVTGMLILAAGLLYGDGLITPAISILSAVEGLEYMTEWFKPYVMWIAASIVLALFAVQSKGTAKVGLWFGWCIVAWFLSIGLFGMVLVWQHPQILLAVNPPYAIRFLASLGWESSLVVLGFVMLAVTGGEAMYADMGHSGLSLWPGCLRCDALDVAGHDAAGHPTLALESMARWPGVRFFCRY